MTLPDCPYCDTDQTLKACGAEPRGVKVCECASCGKRCRVSADGYVIHRPDVGDTVRALGATASL